jgi:pimeloyl-ACP methyl ester carboxylesterase
MFSSITTWDAWRARADLIESDGLAVATYELGAPDGKPITFLHGYPSSSLDIVPVADQLGGDWRVLALDFPGFGASAKPTEHRYSIAAAADAVEAMWAQRGTVSTVLLAHDYGASVGQELLARRQEGALEVPIDAVIWMNGGIYPDLHRPTDGQKFLLDPENGRAIAAAVGEELFVGGIKVTWGERHEMDVAEIHEMWRSMEDGDGSKLMHDLLHYIEDRRQNAERWRAALEENGLPAGFAWGDLDPVSGAHMIERVEERLPDATIVRMADVGHWPLLEAPDVVADVVERVAP